jgi:hypothetical protein
VSDVPLREHTEALRRADRELADERDRRYGTQRAADQVALDKALAAARELAQAHNDLIRKQEVLVGTFATKDAIEDRLGHVGDRFSRLEDWQARLTGGLIVVSVIGVANLVKLWAG